VRIEVANPMDVAKSLAEEAVRVVKLYKGKFIAATDMEGKPIETWLPIPIRFKLGN
jgi:dihydroxyacetone kinase